MLDAAEHAARHAPAGVADLMDDTPMNGMV
jgi:hypothetical protein